MSVTDSANLAHRATANKSEMLRQSDEAAAFTAFGGRGMTGSYTTYAAAMRTAAIAHYRRCLASAIANGTEVDTYIHALWCLRTAV
jgi:hypothetical protein